MAQRFAQLSDPHLSSLENVDFRDLLNKRALGYLSWRRRRRFEHRPEVLKAMLADLRQRDFDQLLVTGDLTHIGLPSEFAQARRWLDELGDSRHVALVPGNHDACVKAPWEDTFQMWDAFMASDEDTGPPTRFPTLRVRDQIAFIGLTTANPKPPLMATGTAGREQLSRLPALLESTADQGLFRVVYLHHCPIAGQERWRKRLTDAPQLQALLKTHGAELVLHGHGHKGQYQHLRTRSGTTPVIAVPSASAMGLHGADVAQYNDYAVERIDKGWHLEVCGRRFRPEHGDFVENDCTELTLERQ
ncbi:MAG: metallophosphoesterase [Pseudomonadota bacterium]